MGQPHPARTSDSTSRGLVSGVRRRFARRVVRRLPDPASKALLATVRRVRRPPRIKISVIIATYNSEVKGLEKLVASLDAQSMPALNVEIIFVDDGSTDDTASRLAAFARQRANMIVHRIPHSGWASRPRNVGIAMARGEYLLFMDHDDELFPRALTRAYNYGKRHKADVVNAKEVRTTGWSWGWDAFAADVPRVDPREPNAMIPMTPHKLYRRKFLLDEQVRFPEGRRFLFEDNYFNVLALARGARVAVLSRHPFYHWVTTEQNTSQSFSRDADEFWPKLRLWFDFLQRELGRSPVREALVQHYLRERVLSFVGPESLARPALYYDVAYGHVQQIVAEHTVPADDDAFLSVNRCRIELVRNGRADLQLLLAQHDKGVTAVPVVQDVHWEGSFLVLNVATALVDGAGLPVRFRRDGDRWLRQVPSDLSSALSPDARDVRQQVESARYVLSVRGRTSRSTWPIAGTGVVTLVEDEPGLAHVKATMTARFDPVEFATTHDLQDPVWDFGARLEIMGYLIHRGLQGGRAAAALLDGVAAIGYKNRDGLYSLDVAAAVRTVTGTAPPLAADAHIHAEPVDGAVHVDVAIPLPDVHCSGTTELYGEVLIGNALKAPARLLAGEGGATLQFSAVVPEGEHPLKARFLGRSGQTGLVLYAAGAGTSVAAATTAEVR